VSIATAHTHDARAALLSLRTAISHAAHDAIEAAVNVGESIAQSSKLFKNQTGATRASIKGTVFAASGQVVAGGVARFLENGTRPHDIVARAGGVLAFRVNGAMVFTRRVHHPGTAPRPFMQVARDVAQDVADHASALYTDLAIRRHNGG
jgi:hypothetical protein